MATDGPLLQIESLSVHFPSSAGTVFAVNGLSFTVNAGETLAIVGESGSGKSTTGLAVMGLISPESGARVDGSVRLRSKTGVIKDLVRLPVRELRKVRGNDVAMIFQEPMSSLNPVYTIGSQIIEAMRQHRRIGRGTAVAQSLKLLDELGIANPERILASHPHQLSGGMRQRVMIAIALSCQPRLLIADEPTTALDVTIQAQILELLARVKAQTGMAVVFITHNLGVVAEIADRIIVMYAGRVVEAGPVRAVFKSPRMPYTQALLRSLPRLTVPRRAGRPLDAIPGNVPSALAPPVGCSFHPRCTHHLPGLCDAGVPSLDADGPDRLVRCARWRDIA